MTDYDLNKIRKVVREEVASTEQRLEKRITSTAEGLKKDLCSTEQRVISEVGKFIEDNLFSMIEEKANKSDTDRLERKLDNFSAKVAEHDKRLNRIESLPSISRTS